MTVDTTSEARSTAVVPFVAGIALSPAEAKAAVDLIHDIQRSVMTEGVDYGIVPGTGNRPSLFKSGAELLLRVHGYGHKMERVEIERDDHGRKYGVTYRCTVVTGEAGHEVTISMCEGYCGYDEAKYHQTVAGLEARERANATRYKRTPDERKWAEEYTAPWNTVIKMAQKRALVGAALQATAASGIFTQDLEDTADPGAAAGTAAGQGVPEWKALGYADENELKSLDDSLFELVCSVPAGAKRGAVIDLMGRLGYEGGRFPVHKNHYAEIRDAAKAALGVTDAETGEVAPEAASEAPAATDGPPAGDPGPSADGSAEDGRPFADPAPRPVFRDELDDVYVTSGVAALKAAVGAHTQRELDEAVIARGGDGFDPPERQAEWLVAAVMANNPAPAEPPAEPAAKAARPRRSKGSAVHAQLAVFGIDTADHKAVIWSATVGRTESAGELTDDEIQGVYLLAQDVQNGVTTIESVRAMHQAGAGG